MKIEFPRVSGMARAGLMLVAGFGLLAAGVPTPARAANLILQGATTASCTYSAASMDASGNLTVTTSSSCGIVPPADTLALSSTSATVVVGGTFNVGITRANPSAGATSGIITVTAGACAPASSTVNFAAGVNSTAVPFIAPGTPGTCTLALTAGTGANLGTPNTFDASVTAVAVQPDLVALSGVPGTLASSGNGTFSVSRSGTNSSGVTANVSATGGCTLSANSVTFTGTSPSPSPASITITAPVGPATCTVTLAAGSGATLGSPNSATVSVSAPPPPPPTAGTCTTTAASTMEVRGQTRWTMVLSGSPTAPAITAAKFRGPGDAKTIGRMNISQTTGYPIPPNVEASISECPGDFSRSPPCYEYNPGGENAMLLWAVNNASACNLDPTKTYYLNVRTWASGTYGVFVDNQ